MAWRLRRYVVIQCGKHGAPPGSAKITTKNLTNFYTGVAVVYKALGNHVVALEIMDSMFVPQNYRRIYVYSYYWIALLTIPHSTAVTLAFPDISLANGATPSKALLWEMFCKQGRTVRSACLCMMAVLCQFISHCAALCLGLYLIQRFAAVIPRHIKSLPGEPVTQHYAFKLACVLLAPCSRAGCNKNSKDILLGKPFAACHARAEALQSSS